MPPLTTVRLVSCRITSRLTLSLPLSCLRMTPLEVLVGYSENPGHLDVAAFAPPLEAVAHVHLGPFQDCLSRDVHELLDVQEGLGLGQCSMATDNHPKWKIHVLIVAAD